MLVVPLCELSKAARGHATSHSLCTDSIVPSVTKNNNSGEAHVKSCMVRLLMFNKKFSQEMAATKTGATNFGST